jgi:hypothetical protein
MATKIAHPLNAPGDFYVEDGCCTSCALPFTEAPGHFKYDESDHCYVCKQPSSATDEDNMINAVSVSEVGCIRYAGSDLEILRKLVSVNAREQCDSLLGISHVQAAAHSAAPAPKKVWWALWRR